MASSSSLFKSPPPPPSRLLVFVVPTTQRTIAFSRNVFAVANKTSLFVCCCSLTIPCAPFSLSDCSKKSSTTLCDCTGSCAFDFSAAFIVGFCIVFALYNEAFFPINAFENALKSHAKMLHFFFFFFLFVALGLNDDVRDQFCRNESTL
mgnify:CR=1 FL=1